MNLNPPQGDPAPEITQLLNAAEAGDAAAAAELLPLVYTQLRHLAGANMNAERKDHTLEPTALVHEAYLRLVGAAAQPKFAGRRHFYAAAAQAMQRILVEHARGRMRKKRGGDRKRVDLAAIPDVAQLAADADSEKILALDSALRRLQGHDPGMAQIVQLRFYAGLSVEQTAEALGVSDRTVKREWALAKAWLHQSIERDSPP